MANLKGTHVPERVSSTCQSQLGRAGASLPRALVSGLLSSEGVLEHGMERGHLVQAEGCQSLYLVPQPLPGLGFYRTGLFIMAL